MPISGLAITLSGDFTLAAEARRALEGDSRIEVGPQSGRRLAATTETQSQQEDRVLREWILGLAGVTFIDIAFISFDDDEPGDAPGTAPDRISTATTRRVRHRNRQR